MKRENILEVVNEVLKTVFDDENLYIDESSTANDIEDWDSLEHINIVVALENRFSIRFNIKEIGKLKNIREMIDIINAKLNEK